MCEIWVKLKKMQYLILGVICMIIGLLLFGVSIFLILPKILGIPSSVFGFIFLIVGFIIWIIYGSRGNEKDKKRILHGLILIEFIIILMAGGGFVFLAYLITQLIPNFSTTPLMGLLSNFGWFVLAFGITTIFSFIFAWGSEQDLDNINNNISKLNKELHELRIQIEKILEINTDIQNQLDRIENKK